jgi:hypothetical protein
MVHPTSTNGLGEIEFCSKLLQFGLRSRDYLVGIVA